MRPRPNGERRLLVAVGPSPRRRRVARAPGPTAPVPIGRNPVLITGGAGFIGSNLADRLAQEGHDVVVYDALKRPGVEANLDWLKRRHPGRVTAMLADLRDEAALAAATERAQAVFHLAAQVAVTTSLIDPQEDFETNARGTLALLEAVRQRPAQPPLVFASTNKVYGDLGDVELTEIRDAYQPRDLRIRAYGIGEDRALDFRTPYGCSKGAAEQYVLDYARSFGLRTVVLRMSCVYGRRQLGTEDQGWVAHFLRRAIAGEPITIYGDGRQVRDVLDVDDAIEAYLAAWRRAGSVAGRAFNLGGGPGNAVSLVQLLRHVETVLERPVEVRYAAWRPADQRYFVADTRKVRAALSLPAPIAWKAGIAQLATWLHENGQGRTPAEPQPARAAIAGAAS